jgi:diguanylate cyclase (GGDEF)-like protein
MVTMPDVTEASWRRRCLAGAGALGFVAVFVLTAKLSNEFASIANISPWWLPGALSFAMMVRKGWRGYPVVVVAEFANAYLVFGLAPTEPHLILDTFIGQAAYLAGAYVARRWLKADLRSWHTRDVLALLLCGVGIGAMGSALQGISSLLWTNGITLAQAPLSLLTWWAGNAVAVVVLGAPLLMLRRVRWTRPSGVSALEGLAQAALVVATPVAALNLASHRSYLFVCFVPLVWVALRRGVGVTAVAVLTISVLTTYIVGRKPEAGVSLADLQLFMGTLAVTALLLGAVVSQLQDLNHDLERRVEQRTTQLNVLNEQLAHEATHDRLTGLANRALFDDRLQNAIDRRRRAPQQLAVILLDLDGFKPVNDRLGHAAGDQVLIEVAARLRRAVRLEDTVARLGGDEFAILLDAGVIPEAVDAVSGRILAALAEPMSVGAELVVVGASVGAAVADGGTDPGTLLREADAQMYLVKRHGKGRVATTALSSV